MILISIVHTKGKPDKKHENAQQNQLEHFQEAEPHNNIRSCELKPQGSVLIMTFQLVFS